MRRSSVMLGTVLLGLAILPARPPGAGASCAAPYLEGTQRLVLERGDDATIEGRSFAAGCRDSMSCGPGPGCDDCEYDEPPPEPYDDIRLRLVQRGQSWDLDVADARTAADDELGWVTWSFRVPRDAVPGRARLVADHSEPVLVRIR